MSTPLAVEREASSPSDSPKNAASAVAREPVQPRPEPSQFVSMPSSQISGSAPGCTAWAVSSQSPPTSTRSFPPAHPSCSVASSPKPSSSSSVYSAIPPSRSASSPSTSSSQSSSTPLHVSAAPGWMAGSSSSQSPPTSTKPAGGSQVSTDVVGSPWPSLSWSR